MVSRVIATTNRLHGIHTEQMMVAVELPRLDYLIPVLSTTLGGKRSR
jgi:hypothetical protein